MRSLATPQPGFSTGTATNLPLPYSEYQYHTRASAAQELDSATSSKALAVEPTMLLKNLTRASVEAAGSRYGSIQQKSDTSRALSRSQRAGRPCAFRNALGRIPWNKELFPDPVTGLRLALRHVLELLPNSSRPISAPAEELHRVLHHPLRRQTAVGNHIARTAQGCKNWRSALQQGRRSWRSWQRISNSCLAAPWPPELESDPRLLRIYGEQYARLEHIGLEEIVLHVEAPITPTHKTAGAIKFA